MQTRITATQLSKSLSDILNRVRYRGERFLIERNGEPVATLGPAAPVLSITMREFVDFLRGLPPPGEGFADDLEAIQFAQSKTSPPVWPN